MLPETRYVKASDGVSIAFQVLGNASRDLVWVPGWVSHLEVAWEEPTLARFFERLASFSRLIMFDKRGTGLSDRVPESDLPTLETRMGDVLAVCDAVGSARTALLGVSEGAPMCALFAATYPERTTALVLCGGFARRLRSADYEEGTQAEVYEDILREISDRWGGPVGIDFRAPSRVNDARFRDTWARYLRAGASPGAAIALTQMNREIDVRAVLASIRVPTLVVHRTGDRAISVGAGRSMAEAIPGARFVELPGDDHLPWVGDSERILSEIERFLTGVRGSTGSDRVLGTVLFTDIVGSTELAAEMGDVEWRDLLEAHNGRVRREFERFDGREAKTTGDGFLATFDGPARAVRCANAITQTVREIGLDVRTGLHTGEIQFVNGEVHGIAVHIGARVATMAGAGEVLVSSTVKDLIAGSGLAFADRGDHVLKGVPGMWRLFALVEG